MRAITRKYKDITKKIAQKLEDLEELDNIDRIIYFFSSEKKCLKAIRFVKFGIGIDDIISYFYDSSLPENITEENCIQDRLDNLNYFKEDLIAIVYDGVTFNKKHEFNIGRNIYSNLSHATTLVKYRKIDYNKFFEALENNQTDYASPWKGEV